MCLEQDDNLFRLVRLVSGRDYAGRVRHTMTAAVAAAAVAGNAAGKVRRKLFRG